MSLIPPFNRKGLLPPGDYEVTFDELRQSSLVIGPEARHRRATWDAKWDAKWRAKWRATLLVNLEILTKQLWSLGITDVFADGSFAEDKDHPNDIDGYFVCDLDSLKSGRLVKNLNRIDPHKAWTWDPLLRQPFLGYPKRQLPMWHTYRVELYPHVAGFSSGTGILDRFGNELEFPSAFRQSRRDGSLRGIIKLKQG